MESLLGQELSGADIPINGAIVFTNPNVELHVDGAPADVLHVKKLKSYIRRANKRSERVSDELLAELIDVLDRG